MTTIVFDIVDEVEAAGYEAASGELIGRYANEVEVEGEAVLLTTRPFTVTITDGTGSADLEPTLAGNGVTFRVRSGHQPRGFRRRTVFIPDSPTPVNFTDLTELDPATLVAPELADSVTVGIEAAVNAIVGAAPAALDTLNELAAALDDDAGFAATVANELATKATATELGAEATTRSNADTALSGRLDTLETQADTFGDVITTDAADYATAAQGTKADAAIPAPASHSDGRVVAWSTSLGAYTEANPTGAVLKASATNTTGTVTTCSANGALGTAVAIPGTAISVTDSAGLPVVIKWSGYWEQTVAGTGLALLALYETTSGASQLRATYQALPNTTATPLKYFSTPVHEHEVGVVTTTRTFQLYCQLWSPAAQTPTARILNTSAAPTLIRAASGI